MAEGKVWMISGCKDEQTSADVSDVMSFGLPSNVGPGGAGGACTSAMAHKITQPRQWQWGQLLTEMREDLVRKRYTQVPQLSSSYNLTLDEMVELKPANAQRTKALLIGINYVGHKQGVLSGCHNDVETWRSIITQKGFDPSQINVLKDDGGSTPPTRANIERALKALVQDAQPGDALFLQYSGHGSQVKDVSGDEASGFDQVLVPMDYQSAGIILDDWIYDTVAKKVIELPGVTLFAVMDCCHSGTILDLPYSIVVTPGVSQQFAQNPHMALPQNPKWMKKKRLAAVAAAGAAGCCVGGPAGCIAAMCVAVCGFAAADEVEKRQQQQQGVV